ncbi:hypothetical protein KIN20_005750 [Parelaphostrongylus tenuis]|uniref:Uncharacterized protein n=1 Tax=Parelaphostrongylus tenuis TaxID=148309 RepID=A0AAD5MLY4_PARTN|nr:hypothetical protein KIN20_005750 [Parelaphostrongylus tenuis]
MWQLSTQCLLTPFSQHHSRQSFLEAMCSGKLRLEDDRSPSEERQCSVIPQCIKSLISSCIIMEPEQRCLWSSILNTTKRESAVASIGGLTKRVFPFI